MTGPRQVLFDAANEVVTADEILTSLTREGIGDSNIMTVDKDPVTARVGE